MLVGGALAVLLGIGPLLTGKMTVGIAGKRLSTRLANFWTIGALDAYAMRPLTARFVGLVLVLLGALSAVQSIRTLVAL